MQDQVADFRRRISGAGVVAAGGTYVVNLSDLLSAAGFGTTFTGYIFVTANFTHAHGAATIYTTSTGAAALSSPLRRRRLFASCVSSAFLSCALLASFVEISKKKCNSEQ